MGTKKKKEKRYDTNVGAKYYIENENGDIEVRRLYHIKNENAYTLVKVNEDGSLDKLTLTRDEFLKWNKILPHAYINCSIVDVCGLKDVIISLTLHEDVMNYKEFRPFAICRQQLGDLFANTFYNNGIGYKVGFSINRNNCPRGITFKDLLICTDYIFGKTVSVYMDDPLDIIFKFLPSSKYDTALYELSTKAKPGIIGSTTCLKELLTCNDFESDFYEAFNITKVDFIIEEDSEISSKYEGEMRIASEFNSRDSLLKSSKVIPDEANNIVIVKYDSVFIDLDRIKRNYILVADADKHIYIVSYN